VFARIRSVARTLVRRDDFERTLSEEMRFHMQAYADDLIRAGVAPDEAQRRARTEFGPRGALEEECREARGVRIVDELRQDIRYAARQLRRSPGFTVAAVLSLALGIGANSAIFGLMDAIVLRTLPIRDPAALFFLGHSGGGESSTSSNYPLLARYQSSGIFEQVTSTTLRSLHVATPEGLERVEGEYVSGNYHATLGVRLALGRGFSNEPDRPDGRAPVAVISDAYWERRFARTPDVIGRTLSIGGRTITIVGVTAPGFHGLSPGLRIDVSLPLYVRAMDDAGFLDQRDRWISVRIVGRLRAEQTEAQALAAVDGLFRRYWSEPENGMEPGSVRSGSLIPAGRGTTGLRDRYGTPLRLLFAMVAIVLLIACTNVANLFLARGVSRTREIAVRLSLGAGRGRLVRQMVTESSLLAIAGGVFGLVLAIVSMRFIASTFATGERPLVIDVALSGRVMAFTAALAIVCSLLVGLMPALRSSRIDVTPALKDSATRPTGGRWSLGRMLVVTQLALSCLIVSVATLLARTVFNMQSIDAGFRGERALLFNLDAGGQQLTVEGRAEFFSTLATRLRALPGVRAVAYTQRSPLDNSVQTRPIEIPGSVIPKELRGISANVVTPEFFDIFDIRLMRGRTLTTEDRAGSEPVAVVDDAMVKAFFGSADPLGRRVIIGADREPFTIVGVVQSGRTDNLREEPFRTIYTSLAQSRLGSNEAIGDARRITVVVQSTTGGAALAASVRAEIASLSPHVVVNYVRTMEQQVATAMLRERLMAVLSTSYGVLALLLSLVGLYGVTSFTVSQRTRDIGVRMALGATRQRVVNAILGETVLTATIGIVIGGVAALFAANLVAPFLFGIEPRDPLTLGGVAILLSATALIAGYIPGRRAASIDPVRALKD
jgi:predicted permease